MQESAGGSDLTKVESVRILRRASSLPDDVTDCPVVCVDRGSSHQPTYADASVATDAPLGTV